MTEVSFLDIKKARKAFAERLEGSLPPATRAYLEALDAKCVRILRCEPAPASEAQRLDELLDAAAATM